MELVMSKGEFGSFNETPSVGIPKHSVSSFSGGSNAERITRAARAIDVDDALARKIAFCESSLKQFDPKTGTLIRGVYNQRDTGLFQINEKYHLARSRELGYDIYTTDGNIAYAMYLLSKEGTKHWYWSKPCWSNPELKV